MPKVLIIDDLKDNLISLSALLRTVIPDLTILTALSGEEGIRLTLKENPDTILLDIQMPKMDGFEVCKKLKQNRKTWRIPIILITAVRTDAESRIRGLETGADASLIKPIDEGELAAQVKAMLRIRHSEQLLSKEKDLLEELVVERTHKLKESEAKFSAAFRSSPGAITISTIDEGRILDTSKSFFDLFGHKRESAVGQTILKLKVWAYPEQRKKFIQELQKKGTLKNFEFTFRKKSGDLRNGLLSAEILVLDSKPHVLVVTTDITQRILAEESLKKSEQKLEEYSKSLKKRVSERTQKLHRALENTETAKDRIDAIIKSVSNGLVVTDTQNRIILMNNAAEELLGIQFSNVINRSIDLAIKEKSLRERFRTTIEEKPAGYNFDFEIPGKGSKKPLTLHASTSVIFDKNHKRSGVVMIFFDVTKEREVDRMKTDFLATAAHELRTPLTSIQGFSEILLKKEGLSTQEREKYLTYINNQSLVLSDLIQDLLNISRIESGLGLTFKIAKCQGDELIKEVLSFFRNISPQHTFDLNLPQKPVYVHADKKKVEQVLKNLIDNAIKYSPDRDKIWIKGVVQNGFFQVSIQDNGIGITPKQAKQIFEKFYRANHGDTQPTGTGLGLTIVKYIVEKQNGKIWVDSKIGKGTTVTFTLPLWKPLSK